MKPGYSDKISAVTVIPARAVNIFASDPPLKIGWASYSIKARIRVERCFRYLDFGYRKHACTGPDRTKVCKNCWKEGHEGNGYKTEPRCGLGK